MRKMELDTAIKIGGIYMYGSGSVEQPTEKAVRFFRLLAEQATPRTPFLSVMHLNQMLLNKYMVLEAPYLNGNAKEKGTSARNGGK